MADNLTKKELGKVVSGAIRLVKDADSKSNGSHGAWDKEIVGQVTAALVTEALRNPEVKRSLLED